MKILFISHSYPPIIGGVENQNRDLSRGLQKITPVKILANGKGKSWLPFFIPWTLLKSFFLMSNYDACLLGNGVLAPLGAFLKFFHPKKKFFCVVHGLDITYAGKSGIMPWIYKKINIPSLKKLDKLFMVGNATIKEAEKVGIKKSHCKFIPNGVNAKELQEKHSRKELSELFGKDISNKKVILRLGRFVPHKGTSWFIENVMPKLPADIVLVAAGNRVGKNTAGDEDDFIKCEEAIVKNELEERVRLLPSLEWEKVKTLLNTVDLVVSPNIKIPGSMEGFGINVIEAGVCARVVLASDLEGLADAIKNGKNGILIEPENEEKWIKKIQATLDSGRPFLEKFGKKAKTYVEENYNWEIICEKYLSEMKKVKK